MKPCQSGKTGEAFNHLNKVVETFKTVEIKRHIAIMFVDNNLILNVQTSLRSRNVVKNCDTIDFTSKSKNYRNYDNVFVEVVKNKNLGNIICCGNSKRFTDINRLIEDFPNYVFTIYIDEADKIAKSKDIQQFIDNWKIIENINEIIMITATPETLFKTYDGFHLLPVNEITNKDYVRFTECPFVNFNPVITADDNEYNETTYYMLEYFKTKTINYGEVYFIPTSTKRSDHDQIENALIQNNIANVVIKINSIDKQITICKQELNGSLIYDKPIPFRKIEGSQKKELSVWLGDYYEKHEGVTKWKMVITGNICVGRGISIQSEKCSITHAIYGPAIDIMTKPNKYQIGARILGNIRNFKTILTKGFPNNYLSKLNIRRYETYGKYSNNNCNSIKNSRIKI